MRGTFSFVLLLLAACTWTSSVNAEAATNWRPVVLMHGLVSDAQALSLVQSWVQSDFPGIYVRNVEIGDGFLDSIFMDINEQVATFAATVAADPKLAKGFNMICHSQGGLICRAYIERYNNPPVYNFASWLGPHEGVYGVPDLNAMCPDIDCPWLNFIMDEVLDGGWLDKGFQQHVTFASYWKDPFELPAYLANNIFLADINNERDAKNATYKAHLTSLNRLLLLYSTSDEVVVPKTSPWFETYQEGQDVVTVPLNQTQQYQEDWIGLRTLDRAGKLLLRTVPCGHHQIHDASCKQYYDLYTRPLLNNFLP